MERVLNVKPAAGDSFQRFLDDPIEAFAGSYTRMNGVAPDDLDELHLAGARARFDQLRHEIPLLRRVADQQGARAIDRVDDLVPLLFDHAFYKSYPSTLIDRKRFADLTRWLARLTTVDLSGVELDGCDSLDEWFTRLDAQTPLRVCHSSGTAGSFSLVPWTEAEYRTLGQAFGAVFSQDFGVDEDCREAAPTDVVFPYFRYGSAMVTRLNDPIEECVAQGPERFHSALPGRLSSDVMYLAGQLRQAAARGRRIEPDSALLARTREFQELSAQMPGRLERFLDQVVERLAGRRVFTVAVWNTVHDLAKAGLAAGRSGVFAPDSVVALGGGAKGLVQPEGWKDHVTEFFGARRVRSGYGMSEMTLAARECDHGRYHLNPWLIPFVLDPDTSRPLPRQGAQTGRAAFFDLAVRTRWGGFVTGDRVTMHFDACPCGQTTAGCDTDIQRFGAARDGEDKITCAATEAAHQDTLEFLATVS